MLKKIIIFSFLGVLIPLSLGLACTPDLSRIIPEQEMAPLPPTLGTRSVSQDFEKEILWRKDHISIRRGFFPTPGLLAGHGYVAYVNFIGGPLSKINQLDILEANTGAVLWQSERFPAHETIAISRDRAFILLQRGSALNIYTIAKDTNPPISLNPFQKVGTFFMFPSVVEENLYIYYIQDGEFLLHRVDLTGTEFVTSHRAQGFNSSSNMFLFEQPFLLLTSQVYQGRDLETGESLWEIQASGRIDSWPVLQDDILIVSAGDGKRSALTAIDVNTGHQLWRTEKTFGSNVVWHKNSLYALRNDAALVKMRLTTGQIEMEIPFSPASIDAGQAVYWLASDGESLFVYFGDSQELFALPF